MALLVKGLNIAIIGALIPLIDKYPILKTVLSQSKRSSQDWDFFMTIGGVGSYLLTNVVSEKERAEIITQLSELDKQMPAGLNHLFDFMERSQSTNLDIGSKIGIWVLWSIKSNYPTDDEVKELAPVLGNYLSIITNQLKENKPG